MSHAPITDRAGLEAFLAPIALRFDVSLGPTSLDCLDRYARRVMTWNERINLSGARDYETLAREHLADALALVPHLPGSGVCIDVGSGAGLPGLILAVARPDLPFILLEPSAKRRAFLSATSRDLSLSNVSIESGRLEQHSTGNPRPYAFAVSRAVFHLVDWLTRGCALVRPGGVVAGLAGGEPPTGLPPGSIVHRYDVGAGPRAIVLVKT